MRGDGDVFLSLAQNDDSGENDSFEDAKEDHDSVKAKTPRIPGGFPEPISPRISNARPRSSGQLLSRRHDESLATAAVSKHSRHSSLADRPFNPTRNAGLGLDRESYSSKYDLRSPKPELLTRARLENMRAFDGNSEYPRYSHHTTSHSVHLLSTETASRRTSGHEGLGDNRSVVGIENGRGHHMPASAGAIVSPPESDSMESQTAPSTVWDELDELKSRINKLEFSGRLPSMSPRFAPARTTDRPRTATTAPTTISSSPHQTRKTDFPVSEVTVAGSTNSGAQQLLQNALSKAKTTLKPHLYRPLEDAADDVLALASMTSGDGSQGTTFSAASIINGGTGISDRQLRRKADSMCRNLTDLCIALCDAQIEDGLIQSSPLSARKLHLGTPPSRYTRRSMEPDDDVASHGGSEVRRHTSRKSINRLDDFRTARGLSPLVSESSDSYQTAERSPRTTPKDYTARYISGERPESRGGPRLEVNGVLDPTIRAPSRAMTDVASLRQAPSQRREHLSSGSQRSPSLRETLAARRASANMRDSDTFSEAGGSVVSGYTPASRRLTDRPRGPPSESIAQAGQPTDAYLEFEPEAHG
ncbi:hypothetical protein MBLNU457_6217t1 [Dothideomycetes sp. NU457]